MSKYTLTELAEQFSNKTGKHFTKHQIRRQLLAIGVEQNQIDCQAHIDIISRYLREGLMSVIFKFSGNLAKVVGELQECKRTINRIDSENTNLKESVEVLTIANASLQEEVNRLKSSTLELCKENIKLNERIDRLERELELLKKPKEDLQLIW